MGNIEDNKEQILKNYNELINDNEYRDSVRYSTGSSSKVKMRSIVLWEY